ncbi:hypothetical protein B7463_g8125, partial [Scytalidium lignicola]
MARDAFKAVQVAKGVGAPQIKLPHGSKILRRPSSWNAKRAVKRIMLQGDNNSFLATKFECLDSPLFDVLGSTIFEELPREVHLDYAEFLQTPQSEANCGGNAYLKRRSKNKEGSGTLTKARIDERIMRDSRKPSKVDVLCKKCRRPSTDHDPRWHRKNGNYIAKKQLCKNCGNQQMIPQNPDIKYVTYNAVMVGLSRVGKPYFRPYFQRLNFAPLDISDSLSADLSYDTGLGE